MLLRFVAPLQPGTISGLSTVCTNSVSTYSISAVSGATSYNWVAPVNSTILSGQGTTTISVSFSGGFTGGIISVNATNCAGVSTSATKSVAGSPTPSSPGAISGPTSVCPGAKTLSYSVAAAPGYTFNWTLPTGCRITTGTSSNSIKVTWGSTSGTISVKKANTSCSSDASTLNVIAAACRPTEPSIEEPAIASASVAVVAYPNPYKNNFKLSITTSLNDNVEIRIYDVMGKLIETRNVKVSDFYTIELGSNYPSGMYNVIVTQKDSFKSIRVIKK